MSLRTHQPKTIPIFANPDRSIWVIIITSVICLAMFIGYLVSLSSRLENIQTQWANKNDELLAQTLAMEDILSEFGYDGYIHNFKNYVLRRDRNYLVALRQNMESIQEDLSQLQRSVEDRESLKALSELENVLNLYQEKAMLFLDDDKSLSAEELDSIVSVNNSKASYALVYLRDKIETDNQAWRLESAALLSQTQVFLGFGTFVLVVIVALVSLLIFTLNRLKYDYRLLKEANQYVEDLIDASPDGLFIVDANGLIVSTNSRSESLFGGVSDNYLGKPIEQLLPNLNGHSKASNADSFVKEERSSTLINQKNLKAVRLDKTEFEAEISLNRITLRNKELEIINVRDVTQQRAFELAAENRTRLETLGQLTAGVAHDFNNILMTIVGNNELIKLQINDDQKSLYKYLDSSAAATSRAAALTARLLAFGRKQALVITSFSPIDAFGELVPALERMLGESIKINPIISPDVWSVETDKEQLESAIINLSVNAKQAMINGGTLTIRAENADVDKDFLDEFGVPINGEFVCVSVSDNGVGMSKEIQAHIFEPFYTTKAAGKGSGLGLSMVYGFIQQSKGCIKVYSQEGTGTTVQLFIPAIKNKLESSTQQQSIKGEPPNQLPGDFSILVVEDDDHVRKVAVELLNKKGVKTISAASPEEALNAAKHAEKLDMIFTDIILSSDKDGVELANEIKVLHPHAKLLFTTGYAQQEILSGISLEGENRVLRKPYNAKALYETIDTIVNSSIE